MNHPHTKSGWIEIICGGMFAGKSSELISRLRREQLARRKVQVFKPLTDDRYGVVAITSHDGAHLDCVPVETSASILELVDNDTAAVGIDEVQFFDEGIVQVAQRLADRGVRVICAGLDQDFQGKPFGSVPYLMCVAEYVTKKHAVCMSCGGVASRSHRLNSDTHEVQVGLDYEARCRHCHEM